MRLLSHIPSRHHSTHAAPSIGAIVLSLILAPMLIADGAYADQLAPGVILSRAIEMCRNLDSYRCKLTLDLTRGKQAEHSEYYLYFKKPGLLRMYVIEGQTKGHSVLLRGDGTIRGRREGLFSVFPVTLRPDDTRLFDLWGRNFIHSDWVTLLKETESRMDDFPCSHVKAVNGGARLLIVMEGSDGYCEKTWLDSHLLTLLRKEILRPNGDSLTAEWTEIEYNPVFRNGFFDF